MNNDKKITSFFLFFIVFFVACFFFASKNGLRGPIEKEEEEKEIKSYAIQTHEYFADLTVLKYVISSKEELKVFNSKFDVDLKLDKNVLEDSKVFVELEVVSSGGIQKEVTEVLIDDSINFLIKTDSEGAMTDDMALWYYVAVIPNSKLESINYAAWQNPKEVITVPADSYDLYTITTDSRYATLRDDGGSYTSIYYEIDLATNKVTKYNEKYEANLTSTPETTLSTIYEKNVSADLLDSIKIEIDNIYEKEDVKDSQLPYNINGKDIYNSESINVLKDLLNSLDNA